MRDRQLLTAERWYLRQLMRLVRQIVGLSAESGPEDVDMLADLLRRYAEAITPWATRVASRMVVTVSEREAKSTRAERVERAAEIHAHGNRMFRALQRELTTQETGAMFREIQNRQVALITSLPTTVAEKVQHAAATGAFGGKSRADVAAEIRRIAGTSESHAKLIARTEMSRAFANLTESRARFAGSTHYVWRTARDPSVRELHARLEGHTFAWNDPPVCEENGQRGHPGTTFNCFVGDTLVAIPADLRGVIRSHYQGYVVTVTAGDASFTVTPNHPILTRKGWRTVDELEHGDEIVKTSIKRGFDGYGDENQPKARIHDVFVAAGVAGAVSVVSILDLYDRFAESEVREIRSDWDLPAIIKSGNSQSVSDFFFAEPNSVIGDSEFSTNCSILESLSTTRSDQRSTIVSGSPTHAQDHTFGTTPRASTCIAKSVFDDDSFDIESIGDAFATHARIEHFDNLGSGDVVSPIPRLSADTRDGESGRSDMFAESVGADFELDGNVDQALASGDASNGRLDHSLSYSDSSANSNFRATNGSIHNLVTDTEFASYVGDSSSESDLFESVSNLIWRESAGEHVYTLVTDKGWYRVASTGIVAKNCRCVARPIWPR